MSKKPVEKIEVGDTGHEWDGIKELNNPLPRWWLWTFYGTVIWGLIYTIAYPAWPLISRATGGFLGYSTRAEVQADIDAVAKANADINGKLAGADLATLATDDPVHQFGMSQGAAVFRTFCAQCHGAGAAGAEGYPNLLDDDWLWGGDLDTIEYTIRHGINATADDETRTAEMVPHVDSLEPEQITAVANYVLKLGGRSGYDEALAEEGATVFAESDCTGCHGENGEGNRDLGVPNLTDAIFLNGDDLASVVAIITNGRKGVMPNWGARLSEAQIKAVTLYVHGQGGGE